MATVYFDGGRFERRDVSVGGIVLAGIPESDGAAAGSARAQLDAFLATKDAGLPHAFKPDEQLEKLQARLAQLQADLAGQFPPDTVELVDFRYQLVTASVSEPTKFQLNFNIKITNSGEESRERILSASYAYELAGDGQLQQEYLAVDVQDADLDQLVELGAFNTQHDAKFAQAFKFQIYQETKSKDELSREYDGRAYVPGEHGGSAEARKAALQGKIGRAVDYLTKKVLTGDEERVCRERSLLSEPSINSIVVDPAATFACATLGSVNANIEKTISEVMESSRGLELRKHFSLGVLTWLKANLMAQVEFAQQLMRDPAFKSYLQNYLGSNWNKNEIFLALISNLSHLSVDVPMKLGRFQPLERLFDPLLTRVLNLREEIFSESSIEELCSKLASEFDQAIDGRLKESINSIFSSWDSSFTQELNKLVAPTDDDNDGLWSMVELALSCDAGPVVAADLEFFLSLFDRKLPKLEDDFHKIFLKAYEDDRAQLDVTVFDAFYVPKVRAWLLEGKVKAKPGSVEKVFDEIPRMPLRNNLDYELRLDLYRLIIANGSCGLVDQARSALSKLFPIISSKESSSESDFELKLGLYKAILNDAVSMPQSLVDQVKIELVHFESKLAGLVKSNQAIGWLKKLHETSRELLGEHGIDEAKKAKLIQQPCVFKMQEHLAGLKKNVIEFLNKEFELEEDPNKLTLTSTAEQARQVVIDSMARKALNKRVRPQRIIDALRMLKIMEGAAEDSDPNLVQVRLNMCSTIAVEVESYDYSGPFSGFVYALGNFNKELPAGTKSERQIIDVPQTEAVIALQTLLAARAAKMQAKMLVKTYPNLDTNPSWVVRQKKGDTLQRVRAARYILQVADAGSDHQVVMASMKLKPRDDLKRIAKSSSNLVEKQAARAALVRKRTIEYLQKSGVGFNAEKSVDDQRDECLRRAGKRTCTKLSKNVTHTAAALKLLAAFDAIEEHKDASAHDTAAFLQTFERARQGLKSEGRLWAQWNLAEREAELSYQSKAEIQASYSANVAADILYQRNAIITLRAAGTEQPLHTLEEYQLHQLQRAEAQSSDDPLFQRAYVESGTNVICVHEVVDSVTGLVYPEFQRALSSSGTGLFADLYDNAANMVHVSDDSPDSYTGYKACCSFAFDSIFGLAEKRLKSKRSIEVKKGASGELDIEGKGIGKHYGEYEQNTMTIAALAAANRAAASNIEKNVLEARIRTLILRQRELEKSRYFFKSDRFWTKQDIKFSPHVVDQHLDGVCSVGFVGAVNENLAKVRSILHKDDVAPVALAKLMVPKFENAKATNRALASMESIVNMRRIAEGYLRAKGDSLPATLIKANTMMQGIANKSEKDGRYNALDLLVQAMRAEQDLTDSDLHKNGKLADELYRLETEMLFICERELGRDSARRGSSRLAEAIKVDASLQPRISRRHEALEKEKANITAAREKALNAYSKMDAVSKLEPVTIQALPVSEGHLAAVAKAEFCRGADSGRESPRSLFYKGLDDTKKVGLKQLHAHAVTVPLDNLFAELNRVGYQLTASPAIDEESLRDTDGKLAMTGSYAGVIRALALPGESPSEEAYPIAFNFNADIEPPYQASRVQLSYEFDPGPKDVPVELQKLLRGVVEKRLIMAFAEPMPLRFFPGTSDTGKFILSQEFLDRANEVTVILAESLGLACLTGPMQHFKARLESKGYTITFPPLSDEDIFSINPAKPRILNLQTKVSATITAPAIGDAEPVSYEVAFTVSGQAIEKEKDHVAFAGFSLEYELPGNAPAALQDLMGQILAERFSDEEIEQQVMSAEVAAEKTQYTDISQAIAAFKTLQQEIRDQSPTADQFKELLRIQAELKRLGYEDGLVVGTAQDVLGSSAVKQSITTELAQLLDRYQGQLRASEEIRAIGEFNEGLGALKPQVYALDEKVVEPKKLSNVLAQALPVLKNELFSYGSFSDQILALLGGLILGLEAFNQSNSGHEAVGSIEAAIKLLKEREAALQAQEDCDTDDEESVREAARTKVSQAPTGADIAAALEEVLKVLLKPEVAVAKPLTEPVSQLEPTAELLAEPKLAPPDEDGYTTVQGDGYCLPRAIILRLLDLHKSRKLSHEQQKLLAEFITGRRVECQPEANAIIHGAIDGITLGRALLQQWAKNLLDHYDLPDQESDLMRFLPDPGTTTATLAGDFNLHFAVELGIGEVRGVQITSEMQAQAMLACEQVNQIRPEDSLEVKLRWTVTPMVNIADAGSVTRQEGGRMQAHYDVQLPKLNPTAVVARVAVDDSLVDAAEESEFIKAVQKISESESIEDFRTALEEFQRVMFTSDKLDDFKDARQVILNKYHQLKETESGEASAALGLADMLYSRVDTRIASLEKVMASSAKMVESANKLAVFKTWYTSHAPNTAAERLDALVDSRCLFEIKKFLRNYVQTTSHFVQQELLSNNEGSLLFLILEDLGDVKNIQLVNEVYMQLAESYEMVMRYALKQNETRAYVQLSALYDQFVAAVISNYAAPLGLRIERNPADLLTDVKMLECVATWCEGAGLEQVRQSGFGRIIEVLRQVKRTYSSRCPRNTAQVVRNMNSKLNNVQQALKMVRSIDRRARTFATVTDPAVIRTKYEEVTKKLKGVFPYEMQYWPKFLQESFKQFEALCKAKIEELNSAALPADVSASSVPVTEAAPEVPLADKVGYMDAQLAAVEAKRHARLTAKEKAAAAASVATASPGASGTPPRRKKSTRSEVHRTKRELDAVSAQVLARRSILTQSGSQLQEVDAPREALGKSRRPGVSGAQ